MKKLFALWLLGSCLMMQGSGQSDYYPSDSDTVTRTISSPKQLRKVKNGSFSATLTSDSEDETFFTKSPSRFCKIKKIHVSSMPNHEVRWGYAKLFGSLAFVGLSGYVASQTGSDSTLQNTAIMTGVMSSMSLLYHNFRLDLLQEKK